MNEAKHCGLCGNTHAGKCSADSFEYFQCVKCGATQMMPFDAVAYCGIDGINCACGKNAAEVWKNISHAEFLNLETDGGRQSSK